MGNFALECKEENLLDVEFYITSMNILFCANSYSEFKVLAFLYVFLLQF